MHGNITDQSLRDQVLAGAARMRAEELATTGQLNHLEADLCSNMHSDPIPVFIKPKRS